jgi:hypothetical protein
MEAYYEQDGTNISLSVADWQGEATYDGKTLTLNSEKKDTSVPSLVGKTLTTGEGDEMATWVFAEDGEARVTGGEAGDGVDITYEQDGQNVHFELAGMMELDGTYDGEKLKINENQEQAPSYPGFYKEEIKRITLLGDGKSLDWKLTKKGLVIQMPDKKPSDYAHVIKIERYHHPKID